MRSFPILRLTPHMYTALNSEDMAWFLVFAVAAVIACCLPTMEPLLIVSQVINLVYSLLSTLFSKLQSSKDCRCPHRSTIQVSASSPLKALEGMH